MRIMEKPRFTQFVVTVRGESDESRCKLRDKDDDKINPRLIQRYRMSAMDPRFPRGGVPIPKWESTYN